MVSRIIVACVCNLVAVLILCIGVFSAIKNSWKISLTKFLLTAGALVGTFFLTPKLSTAILGISYGDGTLDIPLKKALSYGVVNSFLFTLIFLAFYAVIIFVCKLMRHCMISRLREKSQNKAKLKRAKSINPKAERLARRAYWRSLLEEYRQRNKFWSKFFSVILGAIVAVVVGIITLMPYGYIAKRANNKGTKAYLEAGYEYTLNGVIDKKFPKFFDWTIHVKETVVEEKVEDEKIPMENENDSESDNIPESEVPETPGLTNGGADAE